MRTKPVFWQICYTLPHIRPLAVSPPAYLGSMPNPWGFFVSGPFVQGVV